jgi:hypothetical protein
MVFGMKMSKVFVVLIELFVSALMEVGSDGYGWNFLKKKWCCWT